VVNEKNEATVRPVMTGRWVGKDWVILEGLNTGDKVIVDNLIKLRPGAPVTPHPVGEAPAGPPPQSGPQTQT
jgi:membrane fusion protein (multidrug efflux system)